jgi:hypothetical protein
MFASTLACMNIVIQAQYNVKVLKFTAIGDVYNPSIFDISNAQVDKVWCKPRGSTT